MPTNATELGLFRALSPSYALCMNIGELSIVRTDGLPRLVVGDGVTRLLLLIKRCCLRAASIIILFPFTFH